MAKTKNYGAKSGQLKHLEYGNHSEHRSAYTKSDPNQPSLYLGVKKHLHIGHGYISPFLYESAESRSLRFPELST